MMSGQLLFDESRFIDYMKEIRIDDYSGELDNRDPVYFWIILGQNGHNIKSSLQPSERFFETLKLQPNKMRRCDNLPQLHALSKFLDERNVMLGFCLQPRQYSFNQDWLWVSVSTLFKLPRLEAIGRPGYSILSCESLFAQ